MVRDRLRHCVSPRGRRRVAAGAVSAYLRRDRPSMPILDRGSRCRRRRRMLHGTAVACRRSAMSVPAPRRRPSRRSHQVEIDHCRQCTQVGRQIHRKQSPWIHVERRCDIAASALSQTAVANASSTISSAPSARISERISLSRPTPRIHRNTAHGRGNTSAGAPAATGIGTDNGSCEASHGSQLSPCRPPPPIRDGGEDAPPGHRRGGTTRCRAGGRSLRDRSVNPLRELLIQQLEHHGYGHAQLVGVHRRTVPVQRLTL